MTEKAQHDGGDMIDIIELDMDGANLHDRPYLKKKIKKTIFPIGIFLMLFIILSVIAAGASFAYFMYVGKNGISQIESYTRSYSIPLAEAFATMAEMSYREKKYSRLRTLFHEKIEQRAIDQAFVVLKNGKLIAHSDPVIEKKLKGNLASDEFDYNLDLILRPVHRSSREAFFTDYNIPSIKAPFERQYRMLLKTYFYQSIDSTGWLVSKAIFKKKKPVGAVCFIISKKRIYSFITGHVDRSVRLLKMSMAVAFIVSLLVSLVVLVRYRGIQKRALVSGVSIERMSPSGWSAQEPVVVEMLNVGGKDGEAQSAVEGSPFQQKRVIKDAIPIQEKE